MTKLVTTYSTPKYPDVTTVAELQAIGKKRWGQKYMGVYKCNYGGRIQYELQRWKDGYHGRQMVREACYTVAE